jgi:4,5-dihydroxyphthalate decarboxylase
MGKIRLTLACWDYDRTRALQDGRVEVEGVDLTYLPLRVEETFWRMLRYGEFDVAEMSTGSFLMARDKGAPRLIGIPVFPSKTFRHSCIYINTDSGVKKPPICRGNGSAFPNIRSPWPLGCVAFSSMNTA